MDSAKKSLSAPRSAKMHRFLPTPMAVTVPHCLYEEIQSIALLKSEVCLSWNIHTQVQGEFVCSNWPTHRKRSLVLVTINYCSAILPQQQSVKYQREISWDNTGIDPQPMI